MNLLLFEAEELGSDRLLRIDSERGVYLREIQQVQTGFVLRVGQLGGPMGLAEVLSVSGQEVVLEVGPLTEQDSSMDITLVLGLPRPQSLKKVLETVATYGVRRLVLTGANRVQKSYFSSKVLQPEQLKSHLLLGLEQGIGTSLPEVAISQRFSNLEFPEDADFKLLATPSASDSIVRLDLHSSLSEASQVILGVGPEGGWSDDEVNWFTERGFLSFHMGSRVLRVETAVCSLLAQLSLLRQLAGN